jgi:hypothetical protein
MEAGGGEEVLVEGYGAERDAKAQGGAVAVPRQHGGRRTGRRVADRARSDGRYEILQRTAHQLAAGVTEQRGRRAIGGLDSVIRSRNYGRILRALEEKRERNSVGAGMPARPACG